MFDTLPPLKDVIAAHNLRAEKKLGQNFILDGNVTDKIVRQAGDLADHTVFEIGPGPGGLTRSLLKSKAKKVIAIEYDMRAIAALQDLVDVAEGRLEVIHADALEANLIDMAPNTKRAIVANLPYNIATMLLIGWLRQIHEDDTAFSSMTLMFQKEVAQRITAKHSTKAYGRLSILSQWLCNCVQAFDLPPSVFLPPPKIMSSVIHLTPKLNMKSNPCFQTVGHITQKAFQQRRKMVRSSLKDYLDFLEENGISSTSRAENIAVEQYVALAHTVGKVS